MRRVDGSQLLVGDAAVRHIIGLAVGLESVVVAEDQVLHQLRGAVSTARASGALPTELDRLADVALRAGRLARSWRTGPPRSLADVALDRIGPGDGLRGGFIGIVGTGAMGRVAARAAARRGARVVIAGHRFESATRLAREVGADTDSFPLDATAASLTGVVIALRGTWPAPESTIESLRARSVPVIDLSAPSAVDASARTRLGALFTSIDDLARGDGEVDERLRRRLIELVDDTTAEYLRWLGARSRRSAAEALVERVGHERLIELETLWRRLPDLDPIARQEIERMAEHLAGRLLREPLVRLGRDVDGRHERAARELFGL